MQGIICAFVGFVICYLISILLLNQPGAFEKTAELVKQPIYLLFIIAGTFLGLVIGYLGKTVKTSYNHLKKESGKEEKPVIIQFNESLSDTIVVVVGLFSGIFASLLYRWEYLVFIFVVVLLWILYRAGVFQKSSSQPNKSPTPNSSNPAEPDEKKEE
jgi:hypothetical protein